MQRCYAWVEALVLGTGLFLAAGPLPALIMRPTSLQTILADNPFIFQARVQALPADRPALVLTVADQLKGKFPYPKLVINLTGDVDAKKYNHTAQLRKRLAPGLSVLVFGHERSKRVFLFVYTNGTWFQVIGRQTSDGVRWAFTHCEPYLRRTFAGTTAELTQIVRDALAGKKKPPSVNLKEKPGLGPELKKQDKETGRQGDKETKSLAGSPVRRFAGSWGLPLAVIPTFGLGGPLALLAMLFPGLFGGALLVFRNWLALLTVASINSTLLILHVWLGRSLEGTWLGAPQSLWSLMLLVTLAGTLWAWRRHLPAPAAEKPTRSEQVMLWVCSLAFLGSFVYCCFGRLAPQDPTWKLLLVLAIGFGSGTLYVLLRRLAAARRPALPTEGVILWSMIVASVCLAMTWPAGRAPAVAEVSGARGGLVRTAWQAVPPNKSGFIVSPCLVHGGKVYAAAALTQGGENYGTLYCLDAVTGKTLWEFDNDGDLKQIFSAACLADGRLYVGEGFHQDKGCRLYCLNAATHQKLWEFATASHVESSPCVADGKVYFGAGDDGVYCLSTAGKKLWQYPGRRGDTVPTIPTKGVKPGRPLRLHVDASPAVVGNRVYLGSGINRPGEETCDPAVFCLDADTGKKVWLMALGSQELPVWGSPVVSGGRVFYGIGNGDILEDAPGQKPTGALLCVDARTGRQLWRRKVPGGVIRKPAVDGHGVYFGCRDGFCYGLDPADGRVRWKKSLGGPVVASPALLRCPDCGTARLYAVGTKGRVSSFDPDTGFLYWQMDLGADTFLSSSPQVAVVHTRQGERRRVYFGAGFGGIDGAPALVCLEEKGEEAAPPPGR